jgi:hypothetical protein
VVVTVDLRTATVLLLTAAVLGSGEEQARESKSRQVNGGGRNGERESERRGDPVFLPRASACVDRSLAA